jgi:hypothetical protein
VTFQTELGQLIDLITAPEDDVDLSKFSLEKCVPYSSLRVRAAHTSRAEVDVLTLPGTT